MPNHVCLLKKSLYRLKQSHRASFDRLSQFLLSLGFTCHKSDLSLFILHILKYVLLLLINVDNIMLIGNDHLLLNYFVHCLGIEFTIKNLSRLQFFLGIEVQSFSGGIFLSQSKYITDLLS